MAITAKFVADFEDFKRGANEAQASLRGLEGQTDEMKRAFAEMDASIINVSAATVDSAQKFGGLSGGLAQADKTLNALGINLGQEIRAIEELGTVAGKSAKEIGLIGTASLAAAAALGGWQLGRKVAEFFDLDKAIGSATARLMGWGDLAAEEAGARTDVLSRATEIAGREITDFDEAVRINTESMNKRNAEVKAAAEASERAAKATEEFHKQFAAEFTARLEREAEAYRKLKAGVEDLVTAEFRQLAALKAQGTIYTDDVLPKVLQAENELGVTVDDVTKRTQAAYQQWIADQDAWQKEMNDGLVIIGQVGSATEAATSQAGGGVDRLTGKYRQLGDAIKLAVPPGMDWQSAYAGAGIISHGSIAGSAARSASYNINVNASNSFFDTPAGQQALFDRFGRAAVNQMRGSGMGVG